MSDKQHWFRLGLLFYIVISLGTALFMAWGFTTDDAYISWYYASQLVNGNGLVWHQSLPLVEGYSNFLWIVIAGLVLKLQLPLVLSMKCIATVCLFWGLWCLYRLSRLFLNPFLALLPVMVFSHYIGVVWWTVSGLETPLYWALAVFTLWQSAVAAGFSEDNALRQCSLKAWSFVSLGLLLLALTRFEGVVWCVPVACFFACHYYRFGLPSALRVRALGIFIMVLIIPYGAYFIWRLYYFGHWIPNSFSCKAQVKDFAFIVDLDYLQVLIPFLVLSLPYWLDKKDCRHLLLWVPSAVYGILLWRADPVIAHFLRLFQGAFVVFTVAPVLGVRQFLEDLGVFRRNKDEVTAIIVLLVTLIFTQGNSPDYLKMRVLDYQHRTTSRLKIVEILNQQANSGDKVLLGDSGLVPFLARRDLVFIDSQCLNNPFMTQSPYRSHFDLYGLYLQQSVKPEWVIANYYSQSQPRVDLLETLREIHFFKEYDSIAVLKSGLNQQVNYVYQVYKRKKAH